MHLEEVCNAIGVVLSYPIVHIAVGEHGVEVFNTIKCLPVILVLQTLVDSAQIHGICNNCIIILKDNKEIGMNAPDHSRMELDPAGKVLTLYKVQTLRSYSLIEWWHLNALQFCYLRGDAVLLHQLAGERATRTDASIKLWSPPSPDTAADWLHVQASYDLWPQAEGGFHSQRDTLSHQTSWCPNAMKRESVGSLLYCNLVLITRFPKQGVNNSFHCFSKNVNWGHFEITKQKNSVTVSPQSYMSHILPLCLTSMA